jgi:hypothetical protein
MSDATQIVYDFEKDDILILVHNPPSEEPPTEEPPTEEPKEIPSNVIDPFQDEQDGSGSSDGESPEEPTDDSDSQNEEQEEENIGKIIESIQNGGLTNNHETEDDPTEGYEGEDEEGRGVDDEGEDEEGRGVDDEGEDEEGRGADDQGEDEEGRGADNKGEKEADSKDQGEEDILLEAQFYQEIERLKKARKSLEELIQIGGKYVKESEARKISEKIRSIDKIIATYEGE